MPRIIDPSADFEDDGGTPEWRRRHQVIDIYPSRWAALRAYFRQHPLAYVQIACLLALLPPAVFFFGLAFIWVIYLLGF
jgi:hypothetical protein